MAGESSAHLGLMDPLDFPTGEPPSLTEPLVRVKPSGLQDFMAWVHNAVNELAAGLETQKQELHSESLFLRDRLGSAESRLGLRPPSKPPLGSPSAGTHGEHASASGSAAVAGNQSDAAAGAGVASAPHGEQPSARPQGSEESAAATQGGAAASEGAGLQTSGMAGRLQTTEDRAQPPRRSSVAQDDLLAMRLDTVEALLKEMEERRVRHERELQEALQPLGVNLSAEPTGKAAELLANLQAAGAQTAAGGAGASGADVAAPGATAGTASSLGADFRGLENRVASVEELFGRMNDEVRELKDGARDKLIADALFGASDDQVAQVMQAVKDASKDGSEALKKVVALNGDVRQMSTQVKAMASAKSGGVSGEAGAASLGRIQKVEERLENVVGDVRALKDAEREKLVAAGLEGASDDQIAKVLAAVKDASKEGGEAMSKVIALTNEVEGYNVPALTREVQAMKAVSDMAQSSPAHFGAAAPRELPGGQVDPDGIQAAHLGDMASTDLDLGTAGAYSPSGSRRMSASSAIQGQVQQLADISALQTQIQMLADEVRELREDRGGRTPARGSSAASSPSKKARRQAGKGAASPSPSSAGAQTPTQATELSFQQAIDSSDSPNVNAEARSDSVEMQPLTAAPGSQGLSPGADAPARAASRDISKLDVLDEGDEEADAQAEAMEVKLQELQTKLADVRETALKEAAQLAANIPDESRILALEQRVDMLSAAQQGGSSPAGPAAADSAMEAARAAAAAAAVGGGDGSDGGAVAAALAAVDAVAKSMGARLDGIGREVQELRERSPSQSRGGGGGGGSGGAGGGGGGKKQKQKANKGPSDDGAKGGSAGGGPSASPAGGPDGAASMDTSQAASTQAQQDMRKAVEAVAAVKARAEELEQQFEDGGEGGRRGGFDSEDDEDLSTRISRLESTCQVMSASVDELVRHPLLQADGGAVAAAAVAAEAVGNAMDSTGGSESLRPAESSIAHTGGLDSDTSGAAQRALSPTAVGALGTRVGKVATELQNLKGVVQGLLDRPELSDRSLAQLDSRIETRLTAVWTELTQHAKAAATRADALEKQLVIRLDRHDENISLLNQEVAKNKNLSEHVTALAKQIEWLNWRISWLEWATGGEQRSFSRPLDSKAVLPPPQTVASTAFAQPLSEDVELWARGPDGRQRLRRPLRAPLAPAQAARAEAGTLGATEALQASSMRASQSTGRLPRLSP